MVTEDPEKRRPYESTSQAARRSGFSQSYLTFLLRKGTIEGFRYPDTREWFIYSDSLDTFLALSRKPGPKGPRKKPPEL